MSDDHAGSPSLRRRRAWVRRLWTEQPGLHRGYLVDVLTAVVVACALILGGRARTVAPVWRTLNDSGGPVVWGTVFAVIAVVLVAASFLSRWAMTIALWTGAVPYALIGSWFLTGALSEPSASFVGAIFSFRAAFMHVSRATAYWAGPERPA